MSDATRAGYDAVAAAYASRFADELDADLVWSDQRGPYPDVEAPTERTYLLSRRPA